MTDKKTSSRRRETKAEQAARVGRILEALDREYGREYRCYLNHETPWQLLIAVIMSAQCTDARVNIVTERLFKKYDSLKAFAEASLKELEKDIQAEKDRAEEIEKLEEYVGTDEYVEQTAKDKLGLVHENEIIFKSK